jgi:hypothetical protein
MRGLLYTVFSILTAMVGYTIHGSIFWSIIDFFFTPIAIIKWIICHEITLTVIKETFNWFFV